MLMRSCRIAIGVLVAVSALCRATPAFAQSVEALAIDRKNAAFADAPGAGAAAPQQPVVLLLTDEARRAVSSLTKLFNRGEFQQVAMEALRWRGNDNASGALRFRVGMFFEDVTFNMLRLFADSRLRQCPKDLLPVVDNELKQLESLGRGNGAVFGRSAFRDISRSC